MPSSPPLARPLLAALLATLLLVAPALAGPSSSLLSGADAAPVAPAEPGDGAVSLQLESLTPVALEAGGTMTAEITVTNPSSAPYEDLRIELRARTSRVTDRSLLAEWEADESPDTSGAPVAESAVIDSLDPGESTTLTVSADADELGYSDEPYYWGTRRISLTAATSDEQLGALRTFMVWRPDGADASITQSFLLPIAARDPGIAVADPAAFHDSLTDGTLAARLELAQRDDVDWWLDPALLDPPRVALSDEAEDGEDGEDPAPATDTASPTAPSLDLTEYGADPAAEEFAATLTGAADDRTVLARPYARADLLALRQGGADELGDAVRETGDSAWDDADVDPRSLAIGVPGAEADAATLRAAADTDADAVVVPATSLRTDPDATVTPSSIGTLPGEGEDDPDLALLAPDPELSDTFGQLGGGRDTTRTTQRLLAETATIASEYSFAPRHILIAPSTSASLDPAAAATALDAMDEAPWITAGSTDALLDAADEGDVTTDVLDEDAGLFAIGEVDESAIGPSGPGADGRWVRLEDTEPVVRTQRGQLQNLQSLWSRLGVLDTAMEDDAALEGPRLLILSALAETWADDPSAVADRIEAARAVDDDYASRVELVPASGYNLISDEADVSVTVANRLDTPITVQVGATSERPLVHIGNDRTVEVPARSQTEVAIPIEGIANGTVTLTWHLNTPDGRQLAEPAGVPLTVNPAWENWTTMLLVIAMGVLVVVGVARARRRSPDTRAPGVFGPEDPEVLASTGRSEPASAAGPPATDDGAGQEDDGPGTGEADDASDAGGTTGTEGRDRQ